MGKSGGQLTNSSGLARGVPSMWCDHPPQDTWHQNVPSLPWCIWFWDSASLPAQDHCLQKMLSLTRIPSLGLSNVGDLGFIFSDLCYCRQVSEGSSWLALGLQGEGNSLAPNVLGNTGRAGVWKWNLRAGLPKNTPHEALTWRSLCFPIGKTLWVENHLFLFLKKKVDLKKYIIFLAVLGLCCSVQAFSRCSSWASLVAEQELWRMQASVSRLSCSEACVFLTHNKQ